MRDIVERLELQAFVADKIQSGMKPLIMDCLEEITHLRCQYEALHKQGEMNARLLTENASFRAENENLLSRIEKAENAYVRLDASMNRLKAAFRVNMLRAFPNMSHEEIDVEIEDAIWESGK